MGSGVQSIEDGLLFNKSQLARHFQLDKKTVTKRLEGLQPCGKKKGYPAWTIAAAAARLVEAEPLSGQNPDEMGAFERKAWFDGSRSELEYGKEKGLLIEVEEMTEVVGEAFKMFSSFLSMLPGAVSNQLDLSVDQLEKIQDVCDRQRDRLADQLIDR